MFDLEKAIRVWRKKMRKISAFEDGYIEELESHLRDEVEQNINQGKIEKEAFDDAVKRVGNLKDVGGEYYKSDSNHISKRPPWKSNPWVPSLLSNYFKIAARIIRNNKGYSFITTFGLALGIAAFILIKFYVEYEFSYDKYNENSENIYRVGTQFKGHTHAGNDKMGVVRSPLASIMSEEFSEVLSAFRLKRTSNAKITIGEKEYFQKRIYYSEPQIFDILTLPIIQGQKEKLLNDPNSLVISESLSSKFFPNEDPVGKTITLNGEDDLLVSAVVKDIPQNSHFKAEIFLSLKYYSNKYEEEFTEWGRSSAFTYLLLRPETDLVSLETKMNDIYQANQKKTPHGNMAIPFLQKLEDIHLNSHTSLELEKNNNIDTIYLFSFVGLLILLIAGLNYINLTTARSLKRAKEVGIRKTIGAGKRNIIKQFLLESTTLSFSALVFSLIAIWAVLPYFNSYVERDFSLFQILSLTAFPQILLVTLIIGLVAGIYPAFVISSFKPISIFRNKFDKSADGFKIRNIVILFQFSIAIVLIACTLVITDQLNFISSTNVGYQKDQIIVLSTRNDDIRKNLDVIKSELLNNPNILDVSSSSYLPNRIMDQTSFDWPGKSENNEIPTYAGFADYQWVNLFGIEIIEGRNFSKDFPSDQNGAFLLNETAVKSLGWENPIGKELLHWDESKGSVVGVMKDFNFHSLHRKIESLYIYLEPTERNYFLSIKIAGGSISETIEFVEQQMNKFMPEYPFEYSFFDEIFDKQYSDEIKMKDLFSTFALIALLLSGLGLLGLSSYSIERRTKEIGIRKTLGASVPSIVIMLTKDFTKWVVIANIIAWPITYYFMQKWLENFAYKEGLTIWIFLLSGIIILFIAGITTAYQTLKAASANPVDSLKYE